MINKKYLFSIITLLYLAGCSSNPYGYFGNPTLEQVLTEHAEKVQNLPKDSETENTQDKKQHLEDMYQEWVILKPKIEKLIALEAELKATNQALNKESRRSLANGNSVQPAVSAVPQKQNSIPYKYTMQIGASSSLQGAQKFWRQQQKKYPDLLGSIEPVIQHVKKGNKDFYRVKVGKYKARKKAEKDCNAFVAIGGQCMIKNI